MSSVYQASAYIYVCVFDIYNSFDPYAVRFDHKGIRQHLTVCPEICHFHVSLYLLNDLRAMVSTVHVASL